MATKIPLRAICAALVATMCCTATSSAARVERARLTIADNKVSIAGKQVASGTAVKAGDTITTGSRSHAELTLPDGTVVRIGQGSSFTYTGSKLVLDQGTALIRVTRKNTTVVSGSRTYTGGPAVVSAEVSKKTDGLYVLQGGGKVNGVTLIPGQSSVLDRGKERTFTFDLQKLEASSALVTKFPQTPWIAQTQALGAVQHQLLTAKVTPAGKPGSTVASQDNVSRGLASVVGAGRAGRAGSPVSGTLQLLGGPLSLGADKVAVIKSAAISAITNGGTLQLSGATTSAGTGTLTVSGAILTAGASIQGFNGSGLTVNASQLTKTGAGTLVLNPGSLNPGGTGVTGAGADTLINAANFNLASNISTGGISLGNTTTTNVLANASGAGGISTVGGAILNGANTYTGATTLNTGTLLLTNPVQGTLSLAGGTLAITNPNLTIASIGTISPTATINYQTGGNIVFGGVTLPQQAGQTVTINGVNYISTQTAGAGGTLTLQQAAH